MYPQTEYVLVNVIIFWIAIILWKFFIVPFTPEYCKFWHVATSVEKKFRRFMIRSEAVDRRGAAPVGVEDILDELHEGFDVAEDFGLRVPPRQLRLRLGQLRRQRPCGGRGLVGGAGAWEEVTGRERRHWARCHAGADEERGGGADEGGGHVPGRVVVCWWMGAGGTHRWAPCHKYYFFLRDVVRNSYFWRAKCVRTGSLISDIITVTKGSSHTTSLFFAVGFVLPICSCLSDLVQAELDRVSLRMLLCS